MFVCESSQFAAEFNLNRVSLLQVSLPHACLDQHADVRYAGGSRTLLRAMPEGECVSSLLNPELFVFHQTTNLPPPCGLCWPASKRLLLPSWSTEDFKLCFMLTDLTVLSEPTPSPPTPPPSSAWLLCAKVWCSFSSRQICSPASISNACSLYVLQRILNMLSYFLNACDFSN